MTNEVMADAAARRYARAMNLSSTAAAEPRFGALLRAWRSARGRSQLALSLDTGVSSRHLSYMETGRASPSREMVLTLAQALELPLRDRNEMLLAAGFAAIFRETPLGAPALGPVRDAIQLLLDAASPNPAFVSNRRHDVLDANTTGHWLLDSFVAAPAMFTPPFNMGRLLVSPHGLRPHVRNWPEVARKVLARLQRELGGAHARDAEDDALLQAIAPALAELGAAPLASSTSGALPILVGLQLQRGDFALNFFTTITTLGTPLDVTLQELRIETLFPADAATKQALATREAREARAARIG